MSTYHNVRDSYGRFSKKLSGPKKKAKATPKTKKVKPDAKLIINGFLLDASGSMRGKQKEVIDGFNLIVRQGDKDFKETGVNSVNHVAFFGSVYQGYDEPVHQLVAGWPGTKKGNAVGYSADLGMTALWESTATLIKTLEEKLAQHPDAKVILTIFTDGEENCSGSEWSNGVKIKGIIEAKQAEGWVVTFMGAGTKTQIEAVAKKVGIYASNAVHYNNTAAGTAVTMDNFMRSKSLYTQDVAKGRAKNVGFFVKEKKS